MNRNVLIGLVLAVLVLLGIVGAVLSKRSNTPGTNTLLSETQGNLSQDQKSLKDLVSSGSSVTCTFNLTENGEGSGVVYVSGGKVRGDFSVKVAEAQMKSHMIGDGTTSYMWVDGQPTGFKMSFDASSASTETTTTNTQAVDVSKKMDYKCDPWSADASLFVVPTNVKFTDFGAMTVPSQKPGSTQTTGDSAACAQCDSAPEAYRAQCRTALGCK